MQGFDGATWPPGARAEFLGICQVAADGTLINSSEQANGQSVVTGVVALPNATYQLLVNVRPVNALPYALVIPQGGLTRIPNFVGNNANPNASVTIQLTDTVEADTAPFTAFIFCTIPPVNT